MYLNLAKITFLLVCFSVFVLGQEPKTIVPEKQILLNVDAFNFENGIAKDLKKEDFRLYEDNKPVEISYFSHEDSPISVGFLIDVSLSMSYGVDLSRQAILRFLEKSNSKNEYFTVAFSKKVNLVSDFTSRDETTEFIRASPYFTTKPKPGATVLYEAIKFGLENFSKAKNRRRVLFIFWDVSDIYNSGSYKELTRLVKEKNITVYPVGCAPTFETNTDNLCELAEISGGKFFRRKNLSDDLDLQLKLPKESFEERFSRVADQLQNQYTIGFKPSLDNNDDKWRKLKVEIVTPKEFKKKFGAINTAYRKGYYPNSEVVTDK